MEQLPICDKMDCRAPINEGEQCMWYIDRQGKKHFLHDAPDRACRANMAPPVNPADIVEFQTGKYHLH